MNHKYTIGERADMVEAVLKTGKTNAIQIKDIIQATGLSERSVKQALEHIEKVRVKPVARLRHAPYGVFWPASGAEYLESIKSYEAQWQTEGVNLGVKRQLYLQIFGGADNEA